MQNQVYVTKVEPEDMVNSPKHYQAGDLSCIDVMLKLYGTDMVLAFCLLNSFKYQFRCFNKGKTKEDLAKSRWYLDKYLELIEDEK